MYSSTGGSLDPLQVRVLGLLAGLEPRWTLTGGGALGIRCGYRSTRDLDLFWHGLSTLDSLPEFVRSRLEAAGLSVERIQSSPAFVRLQASDSSQARLIIDLVASPIETASEPQELELAGHVLLVDTEHEILANKLGALLSRSELRDLWDVMELVDRGGDLERALDDAAKKDGGFSQLTLAWLLEQFDVEAIAELTPLEGDLVERLIRFKARLSERLTSQP